MQRSFIDFLFGSEPLAKDKGYYRCTNIWRIRRMIFDCATCLLVLVVGACTATITAPSAPSPSGQSATTPAPPVASGQRDRLETRYQRGAQTTGPASTLAAQSEIDALRARLMQCWSPPAGVDVSLNIYVVLHVLFRPDGSLAQEPAVIEVTGSAIGPALAESAKQALRSCQPFTMLKPEHYDQWKDIEVKFNPHELRAR